MRQLTFEDEVKKQNKNKQVRCRHRFIFIPIAFDHARDEVYEAQVCARCGKSNY